MELRVNLTASTARRCLAALILIECALAVIFLAEFMAGRPESVLHRVIHFWFDLDGDGNIPDWFSSMQLFLVGQVLLVAWVAAGQRAVPSRWLYMALAFLFFFLSLDEAAQIHDKLTHLLRLSDAVPRFKGNQGLWIFLYAGVGAAITGLLAPQLWRFLRRHPKEAILMALGFSATVLGGVILEAVSYELLRSGEHPRIYALEVAVEEFFEMGGISVVLFGGLLLLVKLDRNRRQVVSAKPVTLEVAGETAAALQR